MRLVANYLKLILFLFSRNQLTVERDGIARIERGEGGGIRKQES